MDVLVARLQSGGSLENLVQDLLEDTSADVRQGVSVLFDRLVLEQEAMTRKQKTAYEMLRSLVGSEMCIRDRSKRASSTRSCGLH